MEEKKKRIDELVEIINKASYEYYLNDSPSITDQEYDDYYSELLRLEEAYPELKANKNFLELQEELSDTEDKISYARQFYNDTVLKYNNLCEQFPSNIIAKLFHFEESEFFEAQEGTRATPKVKF